MQVADLFARLSLKVDKNSFTAADRLLGAAKAAVTGLIAIKTVTWFTGVVQSTLDLAGKVHGLAQQTGIAIEPLQQLGFAADQSGSSMDELAGAAKKFALLINAANKGGEEQLKVLKSLGPGVMGALKAGRPFEDVLGEIADRFKSMPDGTAKTALAMKVFGKSGAALIPLLNEGKDGIAALREEFVALGAQMDSETIAQMEALGDQQDKLKVAWQGIKNQIAIALLPAMQSAATRALEWAKANRELIASKVREYALRLVEVLQRLAAFMPMVWAGVKKIASALSWFIEHPELVKTLIKMVIAFKLFQAATGAARRLGHFVDHVKDLSAQLKLSIDMFRGWGKASATSIETVAAATNKGGAAFGKAATMADKMAAATGPLLFMLYGISKAFEAIQGGDPFPMLSDGLAKFIGWIAAAVDWIIEKIESIPGAIRNAGKKVLSIVPGAGAIFGGGFGGGVPDEVKEMLERKEKERKAGFHNELKILRSAPVVGDPAGFDFERDSQRIMPGTNPGAQINMGATNVTINAPAGADAEQFGRIARDEVDKAIDAQARKMAAQLEQ